MSRQLLVEVQGMGGPRPLLPSGSAELRVEASTWYGHVPSDWNVDRFKRIATIRNGQVDPEAARYKDLPLFAPNHIESGTGRLLGVESADAQGAESGKFLVEPGEVVYSKIRPELRKVIVAPFKGLCSADMYPICPAYRVEARFLYYVMLSDGFSQYTLLESDRVAMPKINRKALGECIFVYPDRKEQARICEYLDSSCAGIDAAVGAKRQQIDTLDAVRRSAITRAITRGLDPGVGHKSSGQQWLGDIPVHWSAPCLKRLLSEPLTYGLNEAAELEDRDLPRYLRITDFDERGALRDDTFRSLPREIARDALLAPNDVLFARSGATVGKTFMFRNYVGEACFAGYLIRARTAPWKLSPLFLYLFTKTTAYEAWKNLIFTQATIQNISAVKYNYLAIPLPPLSEQRRICEFVEHRNAEFARLSASIAHQTDTLLSYRKSLIHECVTGQRRVTEADVRRAQNGRVRT